MDEDLGLDWKRVTCDGPEFEEASAVGDLGSAMDLYRGNLLNGFHISGCPEFQRWVEQTRERLRETAAGVAWRLAHRSLEKGEVTGGERMGQKAAALVPTDEHQVRRFIEAISVAGDRASSANFTEKFATGLRERLDLIPSLETGARAGRSPSNKPGNIKRGYLGSQGAPEGYGSKPWEG